MIHIIFLRRFILLLLALWLSNLAIAATGEERTTNPIPNTPEWHAYVAKSEHWKALDSAKISNELKALKRYQASLPEHTSRFGFDPNPTDAWFNSAEGERIMAIILSYQTPSGGWSKRIDMSKNKRQQGEAFGVEADYIPTFDNDATSTQLQLLARAHSITHKQIYADAFNRGLQLIIDAQYPNGGWPQNYPLVGGYHDHITYNDDLMKDLMELLHKVIQAKNEFAFVPKHLRTKAQASLSKGLDCVKKTQVIVNGQLTIWGAQHDRITLASAKARNFEMVSLASAESAWLMYFLMEIENPDAEIIKAIHAAAAWFNANKILGQRWERNGLAPQADPTAPPMWARFYEIGTNKPIFGDRDNSIHYTVSELSEERQKGYGWYNTAGSKVLERYQSWAAKYPLKP